MIDEGESKKKAWSKILYVNLESRAENDFSRFPLYFTFNLIDSFSSLLWTTKDPEINTITSITPFDTTKLNAKSEFRILFFIHI